MTGSRYTIDMCGLQPVPNSKQVLPCWHVVEHGKHVLGGSRTAARVFLMDGTFDIHHAAGVTTVFSWDDVTAWIATTFPASQS